jgi:hypothetical protein
MIAGVECKHNAAEKNPALQGLLAWVLASRCWEATSDAKAFAGGLIVVGWGTPELTEALFLGSGARFCLGRSRGGRCFRL